MPAVTLVGEGLATVGREFVFEGPAAGCEGCPYRTQCLNLTEGEAYRITDVRPNAQRLPCAVHEDDVVAVEVEPTVVRANVPERHALAGNKARLAGDCPYVECPSHPYCVPAGAAFDREYRVRSVEGEPPHETCHLDRELTLVELESPE